MKRIITFMMALALILSLSVTAFADGGDNVGSITINNAIKDTDYAVYKIFDATYEGDAVTYTILPTDQFFDDLFGGDGTAPNDYFVYHATTGVVTRNTESGKTDAELFAYLENLVDGATPTATQKAESTTIKFEGLDTGYYVIHRPNSGSANAVTITTTKPAAEVNDKNELPGGDFDKSSDKDVVAAGDKITWTVSFTATNYAGEEIVMCYTVKDALNHDWAAIDSNSIKVTVGGTPIVKGVDWTLVSVPAQTNGFEIDIPWVNTDGEGKFVSFKYPATTEVVITYSATVLDAASANDPTKPNRNHAELEWDTENTPDVPGTGDGTESDVYNLGFTKVDGTNPDKKLANAKFELYASYDAATKTYSNPITVSPVAGKPGVYIVDATSASNTVVTPENGAVVITGLENINTYYLKETVAPDGYNLLTDPVVVTLVEDIVDANGDVTEQKGSNITIDGVTYYVNHTAINVENFSGVELPSTGGAGTVMMITFGTLVALAFAVLMITQKKMSIYKD